MTTSRPLRVAILRCAQVAAAFDPGAPGLAPLLAEDDRLADALRAAGWEAVPVVWNTPGVDWAEFGAALVRSTWDYIDDLDGFLAALARIEAAGCALFNDRATIAWNAHKSYLPELAGRGAPVLPTRLVCGPADAAGVPAAWRQVVVKPEVGIGSAGIEVVARPALEAHLAAGAGLRLVQPFAGAVLTEGEWSFVFLGGRLSHALVKRPAAGDFRVQAIWGGSAARAAPDPRDATAAAAVLGAAGRDPLYARVDMVRHEGRLHLMELELIEPVLYFGLEPEGPRRLAEALRARLASSAPAQGL